MRPGQKVKIEVDAYPRARAAGPCRQHPARLGIEIHRLSARERDRQFRQDRPARAGQDRHRPGPRSERAAAARHLGRADGEVRAVSPAATAGAGWKPRYNPWLIAVSVTIAAFMEVLDSTIVNVALPHIAGSLSASSDEATWALTSYLVANGIVLTISGWLSDMLGRKRYFLICLTMFTVFSFLCGTADSLAQLVDLPLAAGLLRRRPAAQSAVDHPRFLPAGKARRRFRRGGDRHRRRADPGADAGRLHHRHFVVALGLLHQRAGRPRRRRGQFHPRRGSALGEEQAEPRHRLYRSLADHGRPRLPASDARPGRGRGLVQLVLHCDDGGAGLSRHLRRHPVAAGAREGRSSTSRSSRTRTSPADA